jgi:DNA-binding transcriptional LysR family regulator
MNNANSINIRALTFFIDVYDHKSFSIVARQQGVSPSMISRVIQQLEDALGQQLFYRNTRAIIPTEAGRVFNDYARTITAQLNEVRNALQDRTTEPQGVIRLNAPVFFGQKHIAPWLSGLLIRYPKVQIELTLTDDYIDPHIDAADVIFRIGTLADSSLHARKIATQTYHLAASPNYLALYGTPDTPTDLIKHNCLVYGGNSGPNRWLFKKGASSWVHQAISPTILSNNAETLLISALNHMGIVLFPDWLIGDHLKKGQLVSLLSHYQPNIKASPQNISAIYPNARHPPLHAQAVINYFVEMYGDPPYWQYSY